MLNFLKRLSNFGPRKNVRGLEPVILDPTSFSFVNALTIFSKKAPNMARGGGRRRPTARKKSETYLRNKVFGLIP